MKAVVIEDETAAAKNLIAVLKEIEPTIEVVITLDTVKKSVEWFKNNPAPDIVFMDINLADGQSFLIFNQTDIEAPVIFTTAYDEYALEAFKVDSIDYILKPIHPEDLLRALNKLKKLTNLDKQKHLTQINQFAQNYNYLKTFLISQKDKLIPLSINNIACFQSTNNKVHLITTDNISYPIDKTLDTLFEKLDPTIFYRANRQFIIAHHAVKDVVIWFGNRLNVNLIIDVNERIIISKARVSGFKNWLMRN